MATPDSPGSLVAMPITNDILGAVYASDQAMYPVPLSNNRLRDWVSGCPDLSICFQSPKQGLMGVVIVLPLLRQHWQDLLSGKLKEFDIDPKTMFPDTTATLPHQRNRKPVQVGLHVYHIERLGVEPPTANQRRFSEVAMEEVTRRAQERWDWEVIGMSGKLPHKNTHFQLTLTNQAHHSPHGHRSREKHLPAHGLQTNGL